MHSINKKQTLFLFYIMVIVLGLFLTIDTVVAGTLSGRVVEIIDGDTFVILDDEHEETHIRLLGIDAPEKSQAYGDEAKRYLSSLIFGEEISVLNTRKDRYGRTLGRVIREGQDIGLLMIREGYAWAYKSGKTKPFTEYATLQKAAKADRRGLWQQARPTSPSRWRHRHSLSE